MTPVNDDLEKVKKKLAPRAKRGSKQILEKVRKRL